MTTPWALSSCWVISDGKRGMESQCLALAEALAVKPIVKHVALRSPWRQLSPYLRIGHRHAFTGDSDALAPPWPDLLIASGRQTVAASLYVRAQSRRAGRPTLTVQIQDPAISPANFDLVVTPQHDKLTGANVIATVGALHGVTPEKLRAEADKFGPRVGELPRPYVGVLIGGPNAAYRFGEAQMRDLCAALVRAVRETGGSLLVTPSRRTGERNMAILRSALAEVPAYIWDGTGDNPYLGLLGLADDLVVTCNSVNMVSEAVATGKPVHVFDLPGGSDKFTQFYNVLREGEFTHKFSGTLAPRRAVVPPDDVTRAADAVRRIAAAREHGRS